MASEKWIAALILNVLIVGCSANGVRGVSTKLADAVTPCPDALDSAVLDELYPRFGGPYGVPNYLDVWLSHDYREERWGKQFDHWQGEINTTRSWANTLADACAKSAYLHWMDFYERELASARRELVTHAEENNMNAYDESRKAEIRKTQDYLKTYKLPIPPKPKAGAGVEARDEQ